MFKDSVIIAGDNLQAEYHPYFGYKTGSIPVWIETLKEWEKIGAKSFCPGHGPKVGIDYFEETLIYLEDLYSALTEFKKEKTPIEEVIKSDKLPKGYWPEELIRPGWFDYSIGVVYNSIEIEN